MIRFFLFTLLALPVLASAQRKQTASEYIAAYKDIAITEMERYGIPASIKLGQGLLESSAGNSDLATEANNHFGIKCKKDWTGPSFHKDDDAKDECFRKYETVLASYEDHSQFLKNSTRYAELFTLEITDYKGWAHGLKKAGYATNPQYAQLLIKTIEDNRLYEFDQKGGAVVESKPVRNRDKKPTQTSNPRTPRGKSNDTDLPDFELKKQGGRPIMVRNRVQYVVAKQGDTFEALTTELDMLRWQLPKYNDLPPSAKLAAGDVIYIQPKRRKAFTDSHTVKSGETMQSISQEHAIKLSRLYHLNQLEEGAQPSEGQQLKLR